MHLARIPALDGWRGVAILLVIVGHFFPVSGFNLGRLGVEFFFVLSGRLMAAILFVERAPLGEFYFRRASRILPALLVFMIIIWVATLNTNNRFSPLWIVSAATFTLNYASLWQYPNSILAHIWSLCVEEHAYLLLGALALVTRRSAENALKWIVALAALSMLDGVISYYFFHQEYTEVYWRSDTHVASVLAGAASFLAARHIPERVKTSLGAGVLASLCLVVSFALFVDRAPEGVKQVLGAMALALAVGVVNFQTGLQRLLSWAPLRHMGLCSFSLYLWQQPFYRLTLGDPLTLRLAAFGAALVCALISFHLVEKRARRVLNTWWDRRRAARLRATQTREVRAHPI